MPTGIPFSIIGFDARNRIGFSCMLKTRKYCGWYVKIESRRKCRCPWSAGIDVDAEGEMVIDTGKQIQFVSQMIMSEEASIILPPEVATFGIIENSFGV